MGDHHNNSSSSTNSSSPSSQQPQYTTDYLAHLLKDKKQLSAFPNVFLHLERLVDEEINRVRVTLFQLDAAKKSPLELPEADGPVTTVQEKVFVPVKAYPDYNFVGRILGPRGMTAKQLEQETGCKVMVRGRGSMRDKKKEELNRGKPNWEHLNEELHVLISCEDSENRAKVKLARAVDEIKKLLIPAPEGEDELKRKQLMELAIINGTYRPANQGFSPGGLCSPQLRSPCVGAPIILSPNRLGGTPPVSMANGCPPLISASQADLNAAAAQAQLFYRSLDPMSALTAGYPLQISHPGLNPFFGTDYANLEAQAGAILNTRRILGQARDFPYARGSAQLQPPSN